MQRNGTPTLLLIVYGDWPTVISAREDYREMLLRQVPDEPEADYSVYRVECEGTDGMVAAYNEFHGRLKLQCHFQMEFRSDDKAVRFFAESGSGWSNEGASASVIVNPSVTAIESAVKEAIAKLTKAIS